MPTFTKHVGIKKYPTIQGGNLQVGPFLNNALLRLASVAGCALLVACAQADDGSPVVLGSSTQRTGSSGVTGGIGSGSGQGSTSSSSATPSPQPTPSPFPKTLLMVPLNASLTSDPANATLPHGTAITLVAQMSNGQQLPTTAVWSGAPSGELTFTSTGFANVVPGARTSLVTITAATAGLSATASVQVTAATSP